MARNPLLNGDERGAASYGAGVIKIEAPDRPDPLREWRQQRHRGQTLWWPRRSLYSRDATSGEGEQVDASSTIGAAVPSNTFRSRDGRRVVIAANVDTPCGPVNRISDSFADAQARAREMLIEVRGPEIGDYVAPTVVPKQSATPGPSSGPAPPPGAHNDEVYALLGLDAADLDDLAHEGVV